MPKTESFDHYADEYDNWFIDNKYVFQSELKAIKKVIQEDKDGIEFLQLANDINIKASIEVYII